MPNLPENGYGMDNQSDIALKYIAWIEKITGHHMKKSGSPKEEVFFPQQSIKDILLFASILLT